MSDPFDVLENLAQLKFDAIVVDICMPFMDGLQFYEKLLTHQSYQHQPVFFLSESSDQQLLVSALSKGTRELIHFPPKMSWEVIETRIKNKLPQAACLESKLSDITFDPIANLVEFGGHKVVLTKTEYDLLSLLSKTKSVDIQRIYDEVWHGACAQSRSNLPTHTSNLNKKIHEIGLRIKRKRDHLILGEC